MNTVQYDKMVWRLLRSDSEEIETELLLLYGLPASYGGGPLRWYHEWMDYEHKVHAYLVTRYGWPANKPQTKRAVDLLMQKLRSLQPL